MGTGRCERAEGEDEVHRVGNQVSRAGEGLRDERIEEACPDAAGDAEQDSLCAGFACALKVAIGQGVEADGDADHGDAAEDQHRVAGGGDEVVEEGAEHQRKAGAYGKCDGHARDRDRSYKKDVADAEDCAAGEGFDDAASAGGVEIEGEAVRGDAGSVRPRVRLKRIDAVRRPKV